MDTEFLGFDENAFLNANCIKVMFSELVKRREKAIMGYEDMNSNSSSKLNADNDSGYISQNVNSVSSMEEVIVPIKITDKVAAVYLDEDALLEQPQVSNAANVDENTNDECEHLYVMKSDSFLESSITSQNTIFSGFSNESVHSNMSNIIPVATPLILYAKNPIANENDSNYSISNFNVIDSPENRCVKNYEHSESNLMFDNDVNSLSFSSALCSLYDKGFGDSTSVGLVIHETNIESPRIKSYTELQTKQLNPIETNCKTSTPTKIPKPSNLEMSPELFSDEEVISYERNSLSNLQLQKSSEQPSSANKIDRILLTRLQESLCGVLPPPSVTIIQMPIDEMLSKIKENDNLLLSCPTVTENGNDERRRSLLVGCQLEDVKNVEWPQTANYRYHGLHLNKGKIQEDLEYMYVRYAERYIGAETQSGCTVFGLGADNLSPSKRKLKYRRLGKSPGKRLSHLARRRITFSKDSLQSGITSNNQYIGTRTRQIMIDARKSSSMVVKRSPFKRKSPLKMPGRSPRKKCGTPGSSAKKRYAMRLKLFNGDDSNESVLSEATSCSSKASSTKRALFQKSPEKGQSTNGLLRLFGAETSENKSSKRKTPRRALFSSPLKVSPGKSGLFSSKRKLTPRRCLFSPEKSSSSQDCVLDRKRKRLDLDGEPQSKFPKISESATNNKQLQNVFEQRKKKLMWAVAEALRPHNVDLKHPQFKTYASILAKIVRYFLPNVFTSGRRPEGSTTANMLKIARQHAFAVTRGKKIEDIVREAKLMQSRPSKPSGYVGLDNVLSESVEPRNKDNIVQERSLDCDVGYSKNSKKENIERIRKVIDFDEFCGTSTKR